ncbi:MAG: ABC transporter permease subunit [Defluviitaleaceae bacterium]|nr:ABC transporter permease subunit [Defluviitaleaceae bacterium]
MENFKNTPFGEFLKKFLRRKTAVVALAFILAMFFVAIFGMQIAPYDPREFDYGNILQSPNADNIFGTDEFGRDIFSRVLVGTRLTLSVSLTAVTFAMVFGTILGLVSGYLGGIFDNIFMRICDVMFAFPDIILAIAIVAVLGPGLQNVIIAVAVFGVPTFARIMRGAMLSLKQSLYVEAARSIGVSSFRIIFVHIFPGAFSTMIVNYTMRIGTAVLAAASLSFLGLGASPTEEEWGAMLSIGRNYLGVAPHAVLFPGLAILLTVLAFNLLGDGLRDALDPKYK